MALILRYCAAAMLLAMVCMPAAQAQTACTFSLDHSTASYPASGGNDVITIGALPSGCSTTRTVASNVNWITISFGTTGTGAGSTGYTVTANNTLSARTGTITVAGLVFTVTQAAGTCSFTSSGQSTASVGAAGGTGSFTFNTSLSTCPWTVTGANDWLTLTSAASGTGGTTINFSAAPNTNASARTATLTVGSLTYTVNQSAACAVSLSPSSATFAAAGGTGTVAITLTGSSCSWTASSNNPSFITLTGATSGTSNGSLAYSVAANTSGIDRLGLITINSVTFSIIQTSNCTYSISPASGSFPVIGGGAYFTLNASCPWTASSSGAWLTVSPNSGVAGTTSILYSATPNTDTVTRAATISIGTQAFTVTQAGVACAVTVNPPAVSFANSGGTANINVAAADGCAWTAATTASWITVSGGSSGGAGAFTLTAAANTDPRPRTGSVAVANQLVTVTEDAQQCDYQLSPPNASFGASGGTGTVTVTTRCSWTASSSAPWLNVVNASGNGTADVRYSVTRLPSNAPRTATISIGTAVFTITQTSTPCALTLDQTAIETDADEGRKLLKVTGNSACHWSPAVSADGDGWLTIPSWNEVNGGGYVVFHVTPNPGVTQRQAAIVVSSAGLDPLTATVVQAGLMPAISDRGIVNAATGAFAAVAPGEIVIIRGRGLGPNVAVPLALSDDGTTVLNTLGNVQVLFDGMPAPLLSVSEKEVWAVVPFGVAGQTSAQVTLLNQGVVSNPQTLDVSAAAPGVFTSTTTGAGQVDARNTVDGSINNAANAVARNAVITFYLTGAGQTNPAGVDGLLNPAAPSGPAPVLPVTVQIGGQPAAIVAASGATGEVAGKIRIDARVAQQVTPGPAVPVVVRVGPAQAQAGLTIAVK